MAEVFLKIHTATSQFLRRRAGKVERWFGLTFVKRLRIGEVELAYTKKEEKTPQAIRQLRQPK